MKEKSRLEAERSRGTSRGTREAGMALERQGVALGPECSPGPNYRNLHNKALFTRTNLNEALVLTIKTVPLNWSVHRNLTEDH